MDPIGITVEAKVYDGDGDITWTELWLRIDDEGEEEPRLDIRLLGSALEPDGIISVDPGHLETAIGLLSNQRQDAELARRHRELAEREEAARV